MGITSLEVTLVIKAGNVKYYINKIALLCQFEIKNKRTSNTNTF